MEIQTKKINELKPYERNTKKHPKSQIEKIKRSIKSFGFRNPILIANNEIVAGHGRLVAAQELGMTEVPVIDISDLPPEKIKAYRIADNKTAESDWDTEMLKIEFDSLKDSGLDLTMTGFDLDELKPFYPENKEIVEDVVEVDAYKRAKSKTKIKRGDIFQLGEHRLMCGDATNSQDIGLLMLDEKADMIFTDPPWNVNYGLTKNPRWKIRSIQNDNLGDNFNKFLKDSFMSTKNHLAQGAMVYIVMSAQEWGTMMNVLNELDFHWSSTIIWAKDSLVLSRKDYHTQYEPIWYGWASEPRKYPLKDRKQSDLWQIERPKKSEEHPTMKPIKLVARAISNSSDKGDIVIDIFGGSGTTLIAAEQLDRKCYMMEIDPVYCQIIIDRWEKFTKKQAKKLN